jgi:hypothetical protein
MVPLILMLVLQSIAPPEPVSRQSSEGTWSAVQAPDPMVSYGGKNCVLSFGSSVHAGDLLFARTSDGASATATLGVSDSMSNTWNPGPSFKSLDHSYRTWYAVAKATGVDTVTFTTSNESGAQNCVIGEWNWSGGALSDTLLDASGTAHPYGKTASVTTSGNLTANGELVIGDFTNTARALAGPGSGFATIGTAGNASNELEWLAMGNSSGVGAKQTATAAASGAAGFDSSITTFKHP